MEKGSEETVSAGLTLTPEQSRAARALLGWSREMLARKARVHHQTIGGFESGMNCLPTTTLAIRRALERAGVALIEEGSASLDGGAGARLARPRRRR